MTNWIIFFLSAFAGGFASDAVRDWLRRRRSAPSDRVVDLRRFPEWDGHRVIWSCPHDGCGVQLNAGGVRNDALDARRAAEFAERHATECLAGGTQADQRW